MEIKRMAQASVAGMRRDDPFEREWTRVTHREPCPICEKPDWCSIGEKGVCCMRVESAHQMKNGGWFHHYGEDFKPRPPLRNPMKRPTEPAPNLGGMMHAWRSDTQEGELEAVAESLGVSARALRWLRAALTEDHQTLAVPMYDGTDSFSDNPCGIRLRTPDAKFSVRGSKAGVFFPYGALFEIACHRIFITEGPTDAAAALDLGLFAIGRASCRGQIDIVRSCLCQLGCQECVILSDNDGPGISGALDLLAKIKGCRKLVFCCPQKDLRGFVREGGTKEILEAILASLTWS